MVHGLVMKKDTTVHCRNGYSHAAFVKSDMLYRPLCTVQMHKCKKILCTVYTYWSFRKTPFPSGSNTLKALRIVSSGSAPGETQLLIKAPLKNYKSRLKIQIKIQSYLTFKFLPKHCEEYGKVDGARSLLKHFINLLLLHVKTTYYMHMIKICICLCPTRQ